MDLNSTILAISSPPGHSTRGIVRCSGDSAFELLTSRLSSGPASIERGIQPVRFRLEDVSVPSLLSLTPGPRSYTGEDSFELQIPGHPHLLSRVINGLLEEAHLKGLNVRAAGPGEFTARAFLSGRIKLTEAESVAALVAARSDGEILAAERMRDGRLGQLADLVTDGLADAMALVEAGIDFTEEEDVTAIELDDLKQRIDQAIANVNEHLQRSVGLESLQSLPWVVLEGPANAGKSTLFNALLGRERAVVSGVEGTTRDVLVEPLELRGIPNAEILLVDVAGKETPNTHLDEAMQVAASIARDRADLRIRCIPPDEPAPTSEADVIRVATMGDLLDDPREDVDACVSVNDGEGLDELRTMIENRMVERCSRLAGDTFVLAPRQEAALDISRRCLQEASTLLDQWQPSGTIEAPELIAGLIRDALDSIGEINGVISPDEILDRVFSSFCIGK